MKRHHLFACIIVALGFAGGTFGLATYSARPSIAEQSGSATCPTGIVVTKPYQGQIVSGTVPVEVHVPPNFVPQRVTVLLDGAAAGNAQQFDALWRFPLQTATVANGSHTIGALVTLAPTATGGTSYTCAVHPLAVQVQNTATTTSTLRLTPSLTAWRGPTNVAIGVVVKTDLVSGNNVTDVSGQAVYEWSVSLGTITPHGNTASFQSGPRVGAGQIKVVVRYGSLTKELAIPAEVLAYINSSGYPTVTGATPQAPTAVPNSVEAIKSGLVQPTATTAQQGDSELENCLVHVFGREAYDQRIKQAVRLSFGDLEKAQQCFARRNFVIPANLSPVAPDKVKGLPVAGDSKLKIEAIAKPTQKSGANRGIVLSGTGLPNKQVLIYIFSEPLVLATKTDENGRWSYTLQDPLEPGSHEAYVTVEGDDNQPVRSGSFAFIIQAAPKTGQNPLGLSFALKPKSSSFAALYAGAALVLVLSGLAVVWFLLRRKRGHTDVATPPEPPATPNQPTSHVS